MSDEFKKITRDKKGHYIMLKRSIHQEDIIILNFNAPNERIFEIHETKTDGTAKRNIIDNSLL